MTVSERTEEIFCTALEFQDPVEREAFLTRACAGDRELRSGVEELLHIQTEADRFFHESSAALKPEGEIPDFSLIVEEGANGREIGPYKLIRKIGEGGCAVVYMARQEAPVRRTIALKIIKQGMDTQVVIARFEAERQALAMMDHPNIARVYDAGATKTGRPYFIMELVRGVRITEYCDQNRLSVRQRLDLFIQVCQALQHAHQKGIIHRDIKPSNVLVTRPDPTAPGIPKVIDFGIAKATTGQRLSDHTLFTAQGPFIGTPAYMSPEQATSGGHVVDTRSDLYSLGVLFYELLTGHPPFDGRELMESGLEKMFQTLREQEPQKPSAAVAAFEEETLKKVSEFRSIEPARLITRLGGDIDWIAMKALEKEMGHRYQTANAFSIDIQRHLRNEPVEARPPSRTYRLSKLVRRNRAVFIAMGTVAATLIFGLGTSTWLFLKEREARREQGYLREIAELARNNEALLRHEVEARARIAQAALLVRYQRFEEADSLVDEMSISLTEPSLEATQAFGALGDWHALNGRWPEAASRLYAMTRANHVIESDMTDDATRGLLRAGPAIAATGNIEFYETFARSSIDRFSTTNNPIAAEQVMKATLILPMVPEVTDSLGLLAVLAEQSLADTGGSTDAYLAAWRCLALSLFEHRRGDFSRSLEWGRRSREYNQSVPTLHELNNILFAMNHHRLGNHAEAHAELVQSREKVDARFAEGLVPGNPNDGFWHDWVMAKILLREAGEWSAVGDP